jgi:AAA15 family ATPase/GTPase
MIQQISIRNFKSIIEANTTLPDNVGAIVGINGAGKSNLIQAINFVRSLVIGETTGQALKNIAIAPKELMNFNNSSSDIFFGLIISDVNDNQYLLEVTITLVRDTTNLQKFIVSNEALYKLSSINKDKKELIYKREGSSLRDSIDAPIPLNVENDKVAVSLYQTPDVLAVKNIFTGMFIPDQDTIDFRETIAKTDGKGLASLIIRLSQTDPTAYEQFKKITTKLLPNFSSIIEMSTNQNQRQPISSEITTEKSYIVLLQEENLKGQLSMKSLSAGDLRTLFILASALSLKQGATFLYEETENGLHPRRLLDLLGYLDTIAVKKDLQILYSTHSPVVINRLAAEKVLYIYRDKPTNGTKLQLLSESDHVTNIKNLLEQGLTITDYMFTRMQNSSSI